MPERKTIHRKTTRFILSAAVLIIAAASLGAQDWKSVDVDHFHMEWMVDGPNLNVRVSAPVEGWLAVGFDPTNMMKDANILIGYVENGEVVIEDHYGRSQISHKADVDKDGSSDISGISGRESGGTTELEFTIPLDSGDFRDRPLSEGGAYTVIFASSNKDSINRKHKDRASATIVL